MSISDPIAQIQNKAYPKPLDVIQVYALKVEKTDHKINLFYRNIKNILKIEVNTIMGDFNAEIRKGRVEDIVGEYGERNERSKIIVQSVMTT